jgi:outer membrane protein OmpA-like peptidoglycan-associated protein
MEKSYKRWLLTALALVAVVGTVGTYVLLNWLGAIEQRLIEIGDDLASVGDQVDRAVGAADAAVRRSEEALDRAAEAERSALEAAGGRARAEQAQRQAEAVSVEARANAAAAIEEAGEARAETERVRRKRQAEFDRLQEALSRIVETRRTALGLVMNLGSDSIEFDFDRAELRPENRELLSRIVGILLSSEGYSLYVYGHTDDIGSAAYNLELSERRAEAVRDYLVETGIDRAIIDTKGYGKSSPRVEGVDAESRAKNRRVEIGIVDVRIEVTGPPEL